MPTAQKLFIVEAPGKVKTISQYLNQIEPGVWIVKASVGHIRDLASNRMSIDLNTFRPLYEVHADKKKIVSELIQVAKKCAGGVYIATDLDREGEAIAWHIASVLGIKPEQARRVEYSEISKSAISAALGKIRNINMNRVVSQEARRFIDRIVGYTVSPMLHKIIKSDKALSGGRVQSVVLMMIQERCAKIQNFKPIEYYGIKVNFDVNGNLPFKATWVSDKYQKDGYMLDAEIAAAICKKVTEAPRFTVADIVEKKVQVPPPKPFTTSLLQQVATRKLGIQIDAVMRAAQNLYEKGLISYMRTDSHSLSDDFVSSVRQYIADYSTKNKLSGLLPPAPNVFKSGANAQEAHEAIRPTDINYDSSQIDDPLDKQLYDLIRDRTIACQMASGVDDRTTVHLNHNSTNEPFIIRGRVVAVPGWRSLMAGVDDESNAESEDEASARLPKFMMGQNLTADNVEITNDKTKPPAYFTQATLVREMEKNNIGRPATTASLIKVNFVRGYVEEVGKGKQTKIVITDLGNRVCDSLKGTFTFMDVKYTSQLEDALDMLASGRAQFLQIMSIFSKTYDGNLKDFCRKHSLPERPLISFSDDIKKSITEIKREKAPEGSVTCPQCKVGYLKPLDGRFGQFWVCSEQSSKNKKCEPYPDFSNTPYLLKHECPQCQKALRLVQDGDTYQWKCIAARDCGYTTNAKQDGSPRY